MQWAVSSSQADGITKFLAVVLLNWLRVVKATLRLTGGNQYGVTTGGTKTAPCPGVF